MPMDLVVSHALAIHGGAGSISTGMRRIKMSKTKPGMSSWTEDDIRRIADERIRDFIGKCGIPIISDLQFLALNLQTYNDWCRDMDYAQYEQQDTTGDQVECTDTQAEWEKYSPTAD